jgi:TonB family protein
MIAEALHMLWLSTLSSSAAIVTLLLLRKPLRGRFGAGVAYATWLLVPFAAAVALLPAPTAPLAPVAATSAPALVPATTQALTIAPAFDVMPWLAAAWVLGLGICAALFVVQQRRFVRALGQLSDAGERTLRAQATAGCPALVGALRPWIVLPADFDQRYSTAERELILAHERAHCLRGDAQLNVLVAALRCLYWFNPLLHVAASRFRFDQELACDAHVIARFPEARRSYADAMLKTQLADIGLPAGCYWQSSHPLKERISMLKQPLPGRARRALGVIVAAVFVAAGSYAAWAAQPAAPSAVSAPADTANLIRADIVLTVGTGAPQKAYVLSQPGEPFSLADFEKGWLVKGTMTPRDDGTVLVNAMLKHGEEIAKPSVILRAGEPGEIRVGHEATNTGEDVVLQMTVRTDPASTALVDGAEPSAAGDPSVAPASYRKLHRIDYPSSAIAAKIEGVVYVKAHIATDGTVSTASVERADPAADGALTDAAVSGVKSWTFNPETKDGQARASVQIVPVVFALNAQAVPKTSKVSLDPIQVSPPAH